MLSPHSIRPLAALLASASVLAMIQSHALAQIDDIPDTVLVTGSLIRGGVPPRPILAEQPPQTDPGTLTQLTDDELRTTLRGMSIRAPGDNLHIEHFGCDGDWTHIGFRAPAYGRYSIRDNQFCIEATVGANFRVCAKMFRGEDGRLFVQGVPQDGQAPAPPGETTITPAIEACPRQ